MIGPYKQFKKGDKLLLSAEVTVETDDYGERVWVRTDDARACVPTEWIVSHAPVPVPPDARGPEVASEAKGPAT